MSDCETIVRFGRYSFADSVWKAVSLERPHEHAVEKDTAAGDEDAAVCAYCGRPFVHEAHLALHRGLDHREAIDDAEREAFEEAHADENESIRLFRLKAIFVLVIVYFVFVMAYMLI